ncbi:hypothetical protein E1161_08380 [Saccharopolyspora aridisoli]|uniref:Uncharacterized protein n=1 Tax=Saccharopolyspora aridisoli TaxID=2530385 RepID=A0A4R4UQ66_9PSEU|nr:hypothetical protein [Saccharopolyspora aridisoli]TDC94020.1 hypothetical protein E1161_08380 [Saccharopolyspora aridisoli]
MRLFGKRNQQDSGGVGTPGPTKPDPSCSHEAYSATPNDYGEWHVLCSQCSGEWVQKRGS